MAADSPRRRPDVTGLDLIGGPEPITVELHEYDSRWPEIALDHARRIRDALHPMDVTVEHIGSTSVPGLAAKPIVDIVVEVDDITAEEDYLPALLAAGYRLRVREPGHRLVRTPSRDVHVHIYGKDDAAIGAYLRFRDHLRRDGDDRALYEGTKRMLLRRQWDDGNAYADAKTDVIREIIARANDARDR